MLVEFSVLPVGRGESLSDDVAKVVEKVSQSGLPYKVTEMGTIVEGEWGEIFPLIQRCHALILQETARVVTTIKVDDRKGRTEALKTRLPSLEAKMGRPFKK